MNTNVNQNACTQIGTFSIICNKFVIYSLLVAFVNILFYIFVFTVKEWRCAKQA